VANASAIRWSEIEELHVVQAIARVLKRRWNLGLGFAAPASQAADQTVKPPRPPACARIQAAGSAAACCEHGRAMVAQLASGDATPALGACHAGLRELAVPIRAGGRLAGALLCGGFVERGEVSPGDVPGLAQADLETLRQLLTEAGEAIASHLEASVRRPTGDLESPYATRYSYDAIVGRSAAMQELYAMLDRVVDSESTVLIQGENGTGKELVARAIHYNSPRKSRRFVVQNCSAFNDNLLDSELFGHRRGAFTGAYADKRGLFEVADTGTFFLDEVGDMSPSLQVKVLRVIQEGTFMPVGDTESRRVDVRLIAATNRDLQTMVARGTFRQDLFYRLNVINLLIPPLRERRDDIELLIEHFLARHARGRRGRKRLSAECHQRLLDYPWPGNVRELENELERLVVLSGPSTEIGAEHLSPRIREPDEAETSSEEPATLPAAVQALERRMIADALARCDGNKTHAARELDISRRNLIRLVQKYELEP
jgi:two-component system, NtrC family, response regulator HupR/HoxA